MKLFSITALVFLLPTKGVVKEPSICLTDGIWNGHYISYYKNGKKKAEGDMKSNQRCGTWTVWDSTGLKRVERLYRNNFDFDIKSEFDGKGIPLTVTAGAKYKLENSTDGFIEYFPLNEKMIMCTKRVWRTIEAVPQNNKIFKENKLFNTLYAKIVSGELKAYAPRSDEFTIGMDSKFFVDNMDTADTKIAGYRIKEDWVYDADRKVSEKRIIGICPMEKLMSAGSEPRPICWLYFPEVRKILASINVGDASLPYNINTMDDIFFFRYFSSTIYKQNNIENTELKDYCTTQEELKKESVRIENEMLEMEHNVWIDEKYYARPEK